MNFDRIKKMYEGFDDSQKRDFATMVGFAVLHGIGFDIKNLGTGIKLPTEQDHLKYVQTFLWYVVTKMKRA